MGTGKVETNMRPLMIYLDSKTDDKLRTIAKNEQRSVSGLIRISINEFLKANYP